MVLSSLHGCKSYTKSEIVLSSESEDLFSSESEDLSLMENVDWRGKEYIFEKKIFFEDLH